MPNSAQRRRLAALEAEARTRVTRAIERGQARLQQLLTRDEQAALTAYWDRRLVDPEARPAGVETAAIARYETLCRTDPELQAIDRVFGPLQWAVQWGEAWQARY